MSSRMPASVTSVNRNPAPPKPSARRRWWMLAMALVVALILGAAIDRVIVPALTPSGLTSSGQQLPASIQHSKVIRVASYLGYPGVEWVDPNAKKLEGIDIDLCRAIASRFGSVQCQFVETPTRSLLPSLLDGRADIVMSGLGDSVTREQSIDLIDYYSAGLTFLTHKTDATRYGSVMNFCGSTVSVQFALQAEYALDLSAKCTASGKPAVKVVAADLLALEQRKVTAALADYPTAVQVIRQHAEFAMATGRLVRYASNTNKIVAPWGIGVRKDDPSLRQAMMSALSAIMADGTYERILSHWGARPGAISTPQLDCSATASCPVGKG